MTEYQKINGSVVYHTEEPSLEDSVASLMSQDLHIVDEHTTANNLYRKAAKLFINKKFQESYVQCDQLKDVVLSLRARAKVGDDVVINTWSLFFNVVDILTRDRGDPRIERQLLSNDWFKQLYEMDTLVDPKLVYLLTLIKLHNDKSDLSQLRQQVDIYLLHGSSSFHEGDSSFNSFLDLLELYHINLLAKMGEFEESEFLIKSNPHIRDSESFVTKLRDFKKELEHEKRRRLEDQKKKEATAKKREKQLANERAKEKLFKEAERAKQASLEEQEKKSKLMKKTKEIRQQEINRTVLDIIKKRLSFLANRNTIAMVFSVIAVLAIIKNNSLLLHPRVRRWARAVWDKLGTTIQMALKVTYM
jgi:hypothetical protein